MPKTKKLAVSKKTAPAPKSAVSAEEKALQKAQTQLSNIQDQISVAREKAKTAKSAKAKANAKAKAQALTPALTDAKNALSQAKIDLRILKARKPLDDFRETKDAKRSEYQSKLAVADEAAFEKAVARFKERWMKSQSKRNTLKLRQFDSKQKAKEQMLKKKVDQKVKSIKSPKAKPGPKRKTKNAM